ncbi:unnamed protein product [Rhodiola kirilowii]
MEDTVEENNDSLERSKEDMKPKYEMEFDSETIAYDFYNKYARMEGFSIRRDGYAADKNGVLTSRTFVCCKEGLRKVDKRDDLTRNPKAETRTNCGAIMGVKLVKRTCKYIVYRFSEQHNHPLISQDSVHLMPSHRKITSSDEAFLDLTAKSGLSPKSAFELMGQQAGGRESLGFTKVDQKNYLRTVRQKKLKFGEAGYLIEYFSKQMLENPSFFYEMQLDSEEQITNVFWADAKMIMDYGIFGDVVSFDTTYKINEANRPFAVFVGLNHHRQTVIFGAALMYDETTASFIWLFETFLKAMCGKPPQTFFTDQDAAIAKAVLHVMPGTYHRLCIWHLMQNAIKKVGFLFRDHDEEDKTNVFNKFLYQIEEDDEFLSAWECMLDEYEAHDDTWLAATFEIRKKWVHAYVKWTWSAGMQTTQLSESFNASLKGYLKSDLHLPEFFTHFVRILCDKRYKELEAEYDLLFQIIHCKMEVSILIHAREVYTKAIFKVFQAQFEDSLKSSITKCVSNGENFIFTVVKDGFFKERLVKREGQFTVSCSCRMFETIGVLCRHCIKVMTEGRETTLIKKIPEQYVSERWTKNARVDNVVQDMHGQEIEENPKLKQTFRYGSLCSKFVRLASRASESEKTYEAVAMEADNLVKLVEDMLRVEINGDKEAEGEALNVLVDCSNDLTVLNVKGFKKREATIVENAEQREVLKLN